MNEYASIKVLKGVGDKLFSAFSRLGISTLWDLLTYYPRDYEAMGSITDTTHLPEYFKNEEQVILRLKIKSEPKLRYVKKYKILTVVAGDEYSNIELSWFNMPYYKNILKQGQSFIFKGNVKKVGASYALSQPKILKEDEYEALNNSLIPIYALTKGITGNTISKLVRQAFEVTGRLPDYLENEIEDGFFKNEDFMDMHDAIYAMHYPKNMDQVIKARKRLVFDEFFFFVMNVRRMKESDSRNENNCPMLECAHTTRIIEKLPYELTNAQKKCFKEILADISGEYQMNRLVQGDVGSGKTIVAILALITCAANGYQGAMMAPTEVLARQHMENIVALLAENGLDNIKCVLLTGSMTAKAKRDAKKLILDGEASIVIGTHALIQDDVEFKKLGLVITDEQHRFGVKQREKLMGLSVPHVLVMSATPIPRTLAIIVYGDLDISVIDELPASRLPIKNCVVGPNYRPTAYKFIEKQVRQGRQALVVCPMVEESEQLEAENVVDYTEHLKTMLSADIVIEYLHGKMKPSVKNEIMERFAAGDIHVLVSTTVIEVGINVPNTTVMMVENSERFGLAQLHQLRGRVGRGSHQSYCIFMCNAKSKDAIKRLDILNKTNDGFKIAEEDLRQRGPGDLFGFRQSGDMNFKIGDIYTDANTLKLASDYAGYLLENAFDDTVPQYRHLYERLAVYIRNQSNTISL